MLTLIENGFVYAPEPRGVQSVLFAGDRIEKIGGVDRRPWRPPASISKSSTPAIVFHPPGLVDPHEHLLGGSGEEGLQFADA